MHIAIDISPLESGHSGRGVGVYTKQLIESMQLFEKSHTVSLVTHQHDIPETCNIVHYPYFDPFFLTLPLFRKYPSVVTVHDVIPLLYPDKFPAGIKGAIRFQLQKLSLSGIRRVITDSKTSKNDIQRILGRNPNTIDVVYLAPSLNIPKSSLVKHDIKKYINGKPFFMYVGDVNWNKNIPGLLSAFSEVLKTNPNFQILLIGRTFCDESIAEVREIKTLIHSKHLESNVSMPGYVEPSTLMDLYTTAVCLVQPSFYEGFGFPVVDALSLGCPVITSNTSSLAEICGPSLQADPHDPTQLANGMMEIIRMTQLKRNTIIKKGYEWVEQFTWKRVANETVESYKKALQ